MLKRYCALLVLGNSASAKADATTPPKLISAKAIQDIVKVPLMKRYLTNWLTAIFGSSTRLRVSSLTVQTINISAMR